MKDWQLEKLREGLKFYRDANAQNGRLPSWERVAAKMVTSKALKARLKDRAEECVGGEALRRFHKRIATPEPINQEDLKAFLIGAGALAEADLANDADGSSEALAVHGNLANRDHVADACLQGLGRRYSSFRTLGHIKEKIELAFHLDRSGTFFRVEETAERRNTDPHQDRFYAKDRGRMFNGHRTGYGFLATDLNLVFIFLRGSSAKSLIHYVEIEPPFRADDENVLNVMRNGAPEVSERDLKGSDVWLAALNLYTFVMDEGPVVRAEVLEEDDVL